MGVNFGKLNFCVFVKIIRQMGLQFSLINVPLLWKILTNERCDVSGTLLSYEEFEKSVTKIVTGDSDLSMSWLEYINSYTQRVS